MKSKYKVYPDYQGLSFPFLEKLPSSWNIVPLYALSKFRQGKLHEAYIHEDGKFICINSRFVSTGGEKFKHCTVNLSPVEKSDILMVMSDLPNGRALAKALYVTGENNYALNQRVCAITAENVNSKFLYYQLNRNAYFLSFDDGSNQTNLSNYDFKKYPVLVPSEEEQQAIANYLDKTTAKIDTLIEKQTKLIELLREKRQAVISTAVTRGLDNTVAMKDSGVEWLGEIPEGWEVKKLKYSARIQGGKDQKEVLDDNGDYPVYGSGGIFGYANQYLYDGESVLLGRKGTVDKPLYVSSKFWTVDTMYYTIIERACIPKWLYYSATTIHFDYYQYGSTVPSMTQEDLHNIYFSTPSKEEQQAIADYLDDKTSKIDTLTAKATQAIDLLKEKRTALISAAVTGKIDVREIA